MRQPPHGFSLDRLARVLDVHWRIIVRACEYLPVGFGAHHWRVRDARGAGYFLALHDLGADADFGFDGLTRALQTAYWLEHVRELEFVLAPVRNRSGNVVHRYTQASALAVYPWVDCRQRSMLDTPELGRLLARLHASSDGMPPGLLRVEDFRIPWRTQLETALVELDRQWDAGPYAQPARNRLREASIPTRELLALYDRLAAEAFAARSEWVITHGEPYGPNLVETHDGRTLLVDWDSALVASRERDLWEVPADGPALGRYAALTGSAPRRDRLRLYRAWYHLAETAIYIHQFRQSHAGDANDVEAWANFLFHLPSYTNWPELAHATA